MIPFHKGVKFITAVRHVRREKDDEKVTFTEQRMSRAVKDYERWVKAKFPKNKEDAAEAMRTIKEKGFDELQKFIFRDAFQKWKREEKSRTASISRSKRKTDKRRGAWPRR